MKTPSKRFEELVVWQKAHQFTLGVYHLSQAFMPFHGPPSDSCLLTTRNLKSPSEFHA